MRVWVWIGVAVLAGCGGASPIVKYSCEGEPVVANFRADGVQITRGDGRIVDLKAAPAASGTLYTAGSVEFWTKDKKGRLTDDSAVRRCEVE